MRHLTSALRAAATVCREVADRLELVANELEYDFDAAWQAAKDRVLGPDGLPSYYEDGPLSDLSLAYRQEGIYVPGVEAVGEMYFGKSA